jgi:hypothetical protein
MSSSDWIIIPNIGENKSHVPNHQPVVVKLSHGTRNLEIQTVSMTFTAK